MNASQFLAEQEGNIYAGPPDTYQILYVILKQLPVPYNKPFH